jgi:hypothetical protein
MTQARGLSLSKKGYRQFLEGLAEQNLIKGYLNGISLTCEKCRSYIIPAATLFYAAQKLSMTPPPKETEQVDLSDIYDSLLQTLVEPVPDFAEGPWNDDMKRYQEEFSKVYEKYFIEGVKGVELVKELNGAWLTDREGNPCLFVYEECAVVFDSNCSCNRMMRGVADDNSSVVHRNP